MKLTSWHSVLGVPEHIPKISFQKLTLPEIEPDTLTTNAHNTNRWITEVLISISQGKKVE